MRIERALAITLVSVMTGAAVWAQVGRGGSEWLTAQGDAQRTSWIRSDAAISVETMSKPGFELQWHTKLDNTPRLSSTLFEGVTANGVTLFVPMSIVTGSANNVFALDNDTGYVVWRRHFETTLPTPTAACPGGITAAATRIIGLSPPVAPVARAGGAGRGAGYHSMIGQPGEGVPVEARGGPRGAPPPPARGRGPAPGAPNARGRGALPGAANAGIPGAPDGGGPAGGYGRPSGVVYAVSSDGQLHVLGLPSGKDIQQPATFLPANAQWSDAIAVGTTLYASTSGNCGDVPSGVWAIDLDGAAKPVVSWKTNGGDVVGRVAFTSDGTLIATVGAGHAGPDGYANAVVALDAKTLQVKDWFTDPSAAFETGPVVFREHDREIVAAATTDGRVLVLDAASLGGVSHATPLFASQRMLAAPAHFGGALATWQDGTDSAGTRWVLAPVVGALAAGVHAPVTNGVLTTGSVLAMKLTDAEGAVSLQPAWTSHNLVSPATPIIVNGVVFALSTGSPAASRRPTAVSALAVLHAYDGVTGKPLWSSHRVMTTPASERSLWAAMGQVYVGAHDGTIYAFGFVDERR